MAVFRTVIRSDLQKPLVVQQLSGNMFTADNASNEIAVEVTNGGEPVALSGAVTAYAVRADGVTAMFSGTISGNVASVVLPASCYVEVGTLSIVIKVGATTVGACTCYVYRTTTDEIIDPGHVIPSIDELLEQIDACRTATTNANTATANANAAASNANAKAALADEKATLADQKATLANTAAQNADTKASLADTAATNANTKAGLANDAATLANTKAALADEKANLADTKAALANTAATNANAKAGLADTAAQNADAKATLANNAATLANTKAGLAETAATNANTAAGKIDNMTVAASGLPAGSAPIATISEVDGHKHVLFQIPKGDKGKDFRIAFTFVSIAAMEAYSGDIELYDYAMIDTGSVDDVDTGKLYCYEQDEEWHYIGDLSGAQGIKGETGTGIDHVSLNADYTLTIYYDDGTQTTTTSIRGATGITPNIAVGTVTTLLPNQQAYVTRDPSSTAENPVFNFGIPKGDTGAVDNVYGTNVPMSESDSTTVAEAIGGKADKVQNATAGNFAGLDANGNLTDSGSKPSDFLTQHQDISGKLDKNQGAGNAGKFMRVDDNGILSPEDVPLFASELPLSETDTTTTESAIRELQAKDEVTYAHEIVTDDEQQSNGIYLMRTTGGDASLSDGVAELISVQGRMEWDGNQIVMSNPQRFISTGWNLYDHSAGYARVLAYSEDYGFIIEGTYTGLAFSETVDGERTAIVPDANGHFAIEADGYLFVTGGNATDTAIYMTWSDWTNGHDGEWMPYSESTIDLSGIMAEHFPYGLMQVEAVSDEINLSSRLATSRIERLVNTQANMEAIIASGRNFVNDDGFIYAVRETPVVTSISLPYEFEAYDHGYEIIVGNIPVFVQTLYGENLVDKLRHDIPAKLEQHDEKIVALEGRTVNGVKADENGNYRVTEVPYARQIITDESQSSTGKYLIRTTGGDASLSDGEATLIGIKGAMKHTGIVEEVLNVTVNAAPRAVPGTITATIDHDTFVAYVHESRTINLIYTDSWSEDISLYGVTVTGTPILGDRLLIEYHTAQYNEAVNMTVNAVTRPVPAEITATIDESVFKAYVSNYGTYTFSHNGTNWDKNISLYGITVQNTPVNGDQIVVEYSSTTRETVVVDMDVTGNVNATINENTFKAYVGENYSDYTFLYDGSEWSSDLSLYGITVQNTPTDGDEITVHYYVRQDITDVVSMSVLPVQRHAPEAITATINEDTYKQTGSEGTTTFSYTSGWNVNPADYGITVTNVPVNGDSITVTYTRLKTSDESLALNVYPERRVAPADITASIDRDVFVNYVDASGQYVLTFTTEWNVNPALYGITIANTPVNGDEIIIRYVKASRGTIAVSNPQRFVSTGWNLYNHTAGYARVLKYSEDHGFRVDGTYTSLAWSETLDGAQEAITVTDGAFDIPGDGYVWVNGGNATNTAVYMTWSDWTNGHSGAWKAYTEDEIDFSSVMTAYFQNGLMAVGTAEDRIDFDVKRAVSNVERIAYSDSAMENAKASGRQYDADENWIYIERETPVTYSINIPYTYEASDHGMEYVYGGEVEVIVTSLYGNNLVDKLRRDVLVQTDIPRIIDMVYPVGAIYMSVVATSPATLFGGTWQQLKDRFLIGTGDTYSNGATGGAASVSYTPAGTNSGGAVSNHTLTVNEIPSHNHSFTGSAVNTGKQSAGHTHNFTDYYATTTGNTAITAAQMPSHSHYHVNSSATIQASSSAATSYGLGDAVYGSGANNMWKIGTSTASTGSGNNHNHSGANTSTTRTTTGISADHTHSVTASGSIGNKGGGGAHNHGFTQPTFTGTKATINTMPPYLAVYMWKRTA